MCAVPWGQQTNNKSLKKWARAIRLRLRTYSFEFFDGGLLLVGGGGSGVFARGGGTAHPGERAIRNDPRWASDPFWTGIGTTITHTQS